MTAQYSINQISAASTSGVEAFGTAGEWLLLELDPSPTEAWDRMRRFQAINAEEREGMLASIPALFRRGYELVVKNYDYM